MIESLLIMIHFVTSGRDVLVAQFKFSLRNGLPSEKHPYGTPALCPRTKVLSGTTQDTLPKSQSLAPPTGFGIARLVSKTLLITGRVKVLFLSSPLKFFNESNVLDHGQLLLCPSPQQSSSFSYSPPSLSRSSLPGIRMCLDTCLASLIERSMATPLRPCAHARILRTMSSE